MFFAVIIPFLSMSLVYSCYFKLKKSQESCKNSREIMSLITTNDKGCNIEQVFDDLERNQLNTSFNYKI